MTPNHQPQDDHPNMLKGDAESLPPMPHDDERLLGGADLQDVLEQGDKLGLEQLQSTADSLLVHSLLLHDSGALKESTERALQATLSALQTEIDMTTATTSHSATAKPVNDLYHRSRWWSSGPTRIAIAASVLFVLFTFVWQTRLPNAKTLLAQAYQYSLSNLDREYRFNLKQGELQTADGTLVVRGNRAFLLRVNSIAGMQIFGRNDNDYWFAPPIGPVLKSDSRYFIASMLDQHSGGLPYLDPATVIQRLQEGYALQRDIIEDPASKRSSYRIIATNTTEPTDFLRPDTVTLWIDLDSSRVIRIMLERKDRKGGSEREKRAIFAGKLTVDYVTESQLSEEFYTVENQFPGRTVLSRQ